MNRGIVRPLRLQILSGYSKYFFPAKYSTYLDVDQMYTVCSLYKTASKCVNIYFLYANNTILYYSYNKLYDWPNNWNQDFRLHDHLFNKNFHGVN